MDLLRGDSALATCQIERIRDIVFGSLRLFVRFEKPRKGLTHSIASVIGIAAKEANTNPMIDTVLTDTNRMSTTERRHPTHHKVRNLRRPRNVSLTHSSPAREHSLTIPFLFLLPQPLCVFFPKPNFSPLVLVLEIVTLARVTRFGMPEGRSDGA